jgi:threonine dehydratase
MNSVTLNQVQAAQTKLAEVLKPTPLEYNERLSYLYGAKIYLKREDLQPVRSYKIRGAYNAVANLSDTQKQSGVVCASAGNHAQGVAWACRRAGIHAAIFMPESTPLQKVSRVRYFADSTGEIVLIGATYDEAAAAAHQYADDHDAYFIHAFNDPLTIAGQGTVALEILEQLERAPDVLVIPVGGGGLLAGASAVAKAKAPGCQLYGAEPEGAASLAAAQHAGKPVALETMDTFVDGASVRTIGELSYHTIQASGNVKLLKVSNGKLCHDMIDAYQNDGLITEPAGALGLAALDQLKTQLKGKTAVVYISGGNNDLSRYPEIVERSLQYQGLKHYFLIQFSQRPGQLRSLLDNALGPNDDIVRFEYTKKNNKESGPAFVGLELSDKNDLKPLLKRMDKTGITYQKIHDQQMLFNFLV